MTNLVYLILSFIGCGGVIYFAMKQNEKMPSTDNEITFKAPPVSPQKPSTAPLPPNTPPASSPSQKANKAPTLTEILTYMRDFEGKVGDANFRNNNPLNYRFYDPKQTGTDCEYLPMYRPVKCSPSGFAIFKDYLTGWTYAFNDKKNRIKNHPKWTLLDMITNHAPPSENDPLGYTENVAKRAGVDISFPVNQIVLV